MAGNSTEGCCLIGGVLFDHFTVTNFRTPCSVDVVRSRPLWLIHALLILQCGCLQAVNEGPAMILYLGTTDADEAKSRAHNLLGALAASVKAAVAAGRQDDIAFLYGRRGDGIMGRVLEFAKVEAGAVSGDGLILLNVPEQAVFR